LYANHRKQVEGEKEEVLKKTLMACVAEMQAKSEMGGNGKSAVALESG
jgi:hypothetical protein